MQTHRNSHQALLASKLRVDVPKTLLAAACASWLVACAPSSQPSPAAVPADTRIQLRLIETTDLHAHMLGYDYFTQQGDSSFGLEHTAALIAHARAESPNNLLIDNGDLIQGAALGDWVAAQPSDYLAQQVHPVIATLNQLQYDVANLGNHEFDFGLDFLNATMAGAEFDVISANVFYADTPEHAGRQRLGQGPAISERRPLAQPYVIKRRQLTDSQGREHTVNIGVIGFLPPQIMNWNARHLRDQVAVYDMVDAARHFIPQMQQAGADIIVAVPHAGLQLFDDYPQFAEQATLQLAQVDGIDAILFGHQHNIFPGDARYDDLPGVDNQGGYIHGVPAVQPGYWGNHLGVIDLYLEPQGRGWQVVDSQVTVKALSGERDATVKEVVAEAHASTLEWLQTPLLNMQRPLRNYFAQVGPELTVQLVNQAQLEHGKALQRLGMLPPDLPILSAAAPFRNGGQGPEHYTSIEAGEITLANVKDMYVFPNTIQIVKVTGIQLRDWLEMSARIYNQIQMQATSPEPLLSGEVASFNFDVLAGITYELQPHYPARFDSQGELVNRRNHRVYNLRYQGELIRADDEFLVVTNNYRAGGGGNFPHLDGSTTVYEGPHEVRDVLLDYVTQLGQQYPNGYRPEVIENWYLVLPRGAQVYIHSGASSSAQQEARQQRDIEYIGRDERGYGRYRILP
ncbi:bifunctional 2',3'-cyclic-nucleotide 2'-phosphodiesterase/3'-nucleotidase [Aliidiomarina maris]|uniref:2',3'-cyclic-nucleotide 2'-phosphodiesterase/3'-nucleotidase n=1 Tax=Aliidiomarina maris TaxID=531312 RepID=A0A327WYN6_9GAMM|nr:bifunctional 2',3'-cyclic-nucleotide 2'-phosphodiesterase/3'-nucleotidase [Aliidiomarina maris]RAJ96968.1 2',3'-cyclic-nucleotide 2'-phosphodiesterase/3'-nucleotidase [Aliidiomarina maris]RUO24579.1 bifunctional 2',3'-cyclic-nucleotide 2'-phosphodiesterase/3'-nucleotidase [Aliidiomarina maris]